jgi:hypothetical protein
MFCFCVETDRRVREGESWGRGSKETEKENNKYTNKQTKR